MDPEGMVMPKENGGLKMTRMPKRMAMFPALVLLMSLFLPGRTARPDKAGLSAAAYPALGREEMGQFRFALQLADQPLDDYSHMEALDQLGMTSYRYLIAFTAYFLAAEQYSKLPACPELIQPRMDRLIQKMTQKPVWEFWAGVSRGVPNLEPKLNKPYPEEHDPVKFRNIMYSGHVGHMIGLYEMLYRDLKYDRPESIVFAWSPSERYLYDYPRLNQVMFEQMVNQPAHCIECEPNACFPECNQHPILSFLLYDQVHHTQLYEKASPLFLDFFLKQKMIDPNTHETASLYLVKQAVTLSSQSPRFKNALDLVITPLVSLRFVSLDSASADGWTGAFMHAWQPDFIERHYPYQKAHDLVKGPADQARVARTVWEPKLRYGFFALLAAEVGDVETRDQVLRAADAQYHPVWKDGAYSYPYNLDRGCTNLTDKLLALARALPAKGLWTMHNRPFDGAHFEEPTVTGVEFNQVGLRRAIYDREQKALIVTTVPAATAGGKTALTITKLSSAKTYALALDGREVRTVQNQSEITLEVPLDREHDFILQENQD